MTKQEKVSTLKKMLLLELFLSTIRILLLFIGVLLSFLLGNAFYTDINTFLLSYNSPCLEILSFIVASVPAIGILYGIHVRKFFWQRPSHYNLLIFLVSYTVGIIFTVTPLSTASFASPAAFYCSSQLGPLSKIIHVLITGFVTSVFAFLGVDLGVSLKHTSLRVSKHRKKS